MKRLHLLLNCILAVLLILCLTACGETPGNASVPPVQTASPSAAPTEPADETSTVPETEPPVETSPAEPDISSLELLYDSGNGSGALYRSGETLYLQKGDHLGPVAAEAATVAEAYINGSIYIKPWHGFGASPEECAVFCRESFSPITTSLYLVWNQGSGSWESVEQWNVVANQMDGLLEDDLVKQYCKAHELAMMLFGADTGAINYVPGGSGSTERGEPVVEGDLTYLPVTGYYEKWDTLQEEVLSVFTEDWWKQTNEGGGYPVFMEHNGPTYYLDISGGDGFYNDSFADTYRLEKQDSDHISFVVTGHFSWPWPAEDESYEERDQRTQTSWDWTDDFSIELVRTEGGWRFDEFYAPDDPSLAFTSENMVIWCSQNGKGYSIDDVLSPEQAEQYTKAQELSLLLFGGDTSKIDGMPGGSGTERAKDIVIGDFTYRQVLGYYEKWDTLHEEILSLFTEDWWTQRNERGGAPIYVEKDGLTYFLDTAMGDGAYNSNFPDTFRMKSQDSEHISFTVRGHYSWLQALEGETPEERDARVQSRYEWTVDYPITMIQTEDGWRFDEFYVPADVSDENYLKTVSAS